MKRAPTFLCSSILGGMLTLIFLGSTFLSAHNAQAQEPALRIDVAHPPAEKADVRVGLYTSVSNWLDEQPVHGMLAPATDTLTTVIFESLPSGIYGAAIYLDENRNGELDRSFIGLFKEPYGFSKEARVRMGPPRWDDAIFEITSEPVRLYVRLD